MVRTTLASFVEKGHRQRLKDEVRRSAKVHHTIACNALASVPGHAAPALNTLRRLSTTSDESLRMAAAEAVGAIEAARSSKGAATGP